MKVKVRTSNGSESNFSSGIWVKGIGVNTVLIRVSRVCHACVTILEASYYKRVNY